MSAGRDDRIRFLVSAVVCAAVLGGLLALYGDAGTAVAGVSASVFAMVNFTGGYFYGKVARLSFVKCLRWVYFLAVAALSLLVVMPIYLIAYGRVGAFFHDAPLYIAAVVACWAIVEARRRADRREEGQLGQDSAAGISFETADLRQWDEPQHGNRQQDEPQRGDVPRTEPEPTDPQECQQRQTDPQQGGAEQDKPQHGGARQTDPEPSESQEGDRRQNDPRRLTVKKGNRLHVIETADILYIEAMGDYISLVTAGERFVKEETMVYYENILPKGFVRIHRSTIVNMAGISSVELYGKQTYRVRLRTGQVLAASAAGYRNLRSRLAK